LKPDLGKKKMIEIISDHVTPEIIKLFRRDEPQAPRCFRVLKGVIQSGKIFTDDVENPTWSVVQEPHDHSLYFGGSIDSEIMFSVITKLRKVGDVLVGMWLDDPRIDQLPGDNYYDGWTLEFYNRPIGKGLSKYINSLPDDCELHRLDRNLIMQTEWGTDDVQFAGGAEKWEKKYIGYCLKNEARIAAEATAGPSVLGMYEPGVFTQERHRKKGYGTIVSARLIQEIESLGGQTYWNCAKQNLASAAIARKLGYRVEKEYRCIAWKKV
jgi:RimJ/RimL family protein N-acetyltransferase